MADRPAPRLEEVGIAPEMVEAAAEELWDWIIRSGYNETFSMDIARAPAKAILAAAFRRKAFF